MSEQLINAFVSVLGLLVGVVMGLTGAGGGIIAVPSLVNGLDWQMQQAMPVALLAVTAGAAIGAIDGLRKRWVRYRAALLMAIAGAPLTMLGVIVAKQVSQQTLLIMFAVIVMLAAVRLLIQLRQPEDLNDTTTEFAHINRATGRFDWSWSSAAAIAAIGASAGFATGLLGVGGGFVIVPMLRKFTNADMHVATSTSLMVIALVGSAGVFSALRQGASMPASIASVFVLATIGGVLLGRYLLNFISARRVQWGFALMLLLLAMQLSFKAFH